MNFPFAPPRPFPLIPMMLTYLGLNLAAGAVPMDFSVQGTTDFLSDIAKTLQQNDQDGDGELNAAELGSRKWMLMVSDGNRNGALSRGELREAMAKLSQRLFHSRPAEPTPGSPPPWVPAPEENSQPRPLKASEWGVGRLIPNLPLQTREGRPVFLRDLLGKTGLVIALVPPQVSSNDAAARLAGRLQQTYAASGFRFVALASPGAGAEEKESGVPESWAQLNDPDLALARALGATRFSDVFVLDAAGTLQYRGAMDAGPGGAPDPSGKSVSWLESAMQAVVRKDRPHPAATTSAGPELTLPVKAKPDGNLPLTWHHRISRIMQVHCQACHQEGGAGPFPLETPEQLIRKAKTVLRVLENQQMPPWTAAAAADPAHTPWINESSLPGSDRRDLVTWLQGDRALGDPAMAPLPRTWPEDWQMGVPDAVLQLPAPIAIPAEGILPYQSVIVETGLISDQWVQAWEVRPTEREVVHHVLVYAYSPADQIPAVAERRGHLASWVPGQGPAVYPADHAKFLPAGSRLRFEIHYTPIGRAVEERMQLGLRFAPAPPKYRVEVAGIADVQLAIPPGATHHPEAATWTAPLDLRILSLSPHMHVRGKAMRFEVTLPGASPATLLEVPRYDFNWQIPVAYAVPPSIPKGSILKATGWFDNSDQNPANPDPADTVRWGSQTTDEMMIGYVEYARLREAE